MSAELVGGSVAGLVIAVGYAAKLGWDAWQSKRNSDTTAEVTPVANAATANEMALATLEAVARERDRVEKRLGEVERALAETRDEARKERLKREAQAKRLDTHDREIGYMKKQFALAVAHIRALLAFIADKGLTDEAPKPPSGLHLD